MRGHVRWVNTPVEALEHIRHERRDEAKSGIWFEISSKGLILDTLHFVIKRTWIVLREKT